MNAVETATVGGWGEVLAACRKNRREEIRITLGEWQGHRLVNVRIWYTERDGSDPKPGKGFALSPEAFEGFVEAVHAARERMREG